MDLYSLVTPIIPAVCELSADQPVYRGVTLADVRAEILSPDWLNTVASALPAARVARVDVVQALRAD